MPDCIRGANDKGGGSQNREADIMDSYRWCKPTAVTQSHNP